MPQHLHLNSVILRECAVYVPAIVSSFAHVVVTVRCYRDSLYQASVLVEIGLKLIGIFLMQTQHLLISCSNTLEECLLSTDIYT